MQDDNASTPYLQLDQKTATDTLQEMVKTLDERESTILRYRFGLDGGSEKLWKKSARNLASPASVCAKSRTSRPRQAPQDDRKT